LQIKATLQSLSIFVEQLVDWNQTRSQSALQSDGIECIWVDAAANVR